MARTSSPGVLLESSLPAAALMQAIIEDPLPNMFTKWGPFPGVIRVQMHDEVWQVGSRRTIHTSDGRKMVEQFVRFAEDESFAYKLNRLEGLFGFLIADIDDLWSFTHAANGTTVAWTWVLHPKPGRSLPVFLVGRLWRVYMGRILRSTLRRLEAASSI